MLVNLLWGNQHVCQPLLGKLTCLSVYIGLVDMFVNLHCEIDMFFNLLWEIKHVC